MAHSFAVSLLNKKNCYKFNPEVQHLLTFWRFWKQLLQFHSRNQPFQVLVLSVLHMIQKTLSRYFGIGWYRRKKPS